MKSKWWVLLACAVGAWPAAGCAPLTFSNDAAIDYERYRSVRVEVNSDYGTEYLAGELRRASGFRAVTTDPAQRVDLILSVRVSVRRSVRIDADGDLDHRYESSAVFRAFTPQGYEVDAGEVSESSAFSSEALEDALDQVAHHYLKPYRA